MKVLFDIYYYKQIIILKPLGFIVGYLIHLITNPFKDEKPSNEQKTDVEQLLSIIERVGDKVVIDEGGIELLQDAMDFFSEISASEGMTSRVYMISIDIDDDWQEILETIDKSSFTRLPVYEDSLDNINRYFVP